MNHTTMSLRLAASLGADQVRPAPAARLSDMSKMLKQLFEQALKGGAKTPGAAAAAVGSIWQWLKSLIRRVAQKLGFKISAPDKLTEEQACGQAPVGAELLGDSASGIPARAAEGAILEEARILCDHLLDASRPVAIVESEEGRQAVDHQLYELVRLRFVLDTKYQDAEKALLGELNAAAVSMGHADGDGLRAMLNENKVQLSRLLGAEHCDRFIESAKAVEQMRLAVARVDTAIAALVDTVQASWTHQPQFAADRVREVLPQLFARGGVLHAESDRVGKVTPEVHSPAKEGVDANDTPNPSVAAEISQPYNGAQTTTTRTELQAAQDGGEAKSNRSIDDEPTSLEVQKAMKSPFMGLSRGRLQGEDSDVADVMPGVRDLAPAVRSIERG